MRDQSIVIIGAAFCLAGCFSRPVAPILQDNIVLPPTTSDRTTTSPIRTEAAIWFATTNRTSGGALSRLDLATGEFNHQVLATGSDPYIVRDGTNGLLLLTRMQQDSITSLTGPDAQVTGQLAFGEGSNPQAAARDPEGKVWVTFQDNNTITVLARDLRKTLGTVDLSSLIEPNSPDGSAEISQIVATSTGQIAVSAQRLRRSLQHWKPESESGLALINSNDLQIESTHLLPVANPRFLFQRSLVGSEFPQLVTVGAGDLGSTSGAPSGIHWFSLASRSTAAQTTYPHRILSAAWTDSGTGDHSPLLTTLVWYPQANRSCIFVGDRSLLCEGSAADGGYVFNHVIQYRDLVFASYVGTQNAQLWIIPTAGNGLASVETIQKIDLRLPIESLTFGP